MLKLERLRKSWPDFSIEASFELEEGEIAAVLGPSGSGKSTLLRMIAGLEKPDAGTIYLSGRDISDLAPEKRKIGLVFQDFALFPQFSVRKNIDYGPRMMRLPLAERRRRVQLLAKSFEISQLLDRNPKSLSGGEQQRVALARALAADPELILLDEPLSSLDTALRGRLRGELAIQLKKQHKTALLITHDAQEAFAIASRIFIIGQGRIVESGSPEQIFEHPRSAFTVRLLDSGPLFHCRELRQNGEYFEVHSELGCFEAMKGPRGSVSRENLSQMFLYFPQEAVQFLGESEGRVRGKNEFSGRVLSLTYEGYHCSAEVGCETEHGGLLTLKLGLPPGLKPAIGTKLSFYIPPYSAVLVQES